MTDVHELAMMPIAFLLNQPEPYARLAAGYRDLHNGYREVVNNGVWGYQLHVYQTMIRDRFGGEVWRAVRAQQIQVLDPDENDGKAVQQTLSLINAALSDAAAGVPNSAGVVTVSAEMRIALALLLNDPASPDYVPDGAGRNARTSNLRLAVDSSFSSCLAAACAEIVENFSGILAHINASRDPA